MESFPKNLGGLLLQSKECDGKKKELKNNRGEKMKKFHGCMPAIVTPFLDGEVDNRSLRDLIEFQIKSGAHGIVACGTTGESATLSFDEHKEVIKETVLAVNKRVPVIAGTGANNTIEAIELTKSAKKTGADAVLSVAPYYNKPSQEGLYQHFKKIAESVNIPVFLYNVPSRTVTDMLPDTVARLAVLPNIIGIKEASGSLHRISQLIRVCPNDFIILSGDDMTAVPTIFMGGHGVISVTANVYPDLFAEMISAALNEEVKMARNKHDILLTAMEAMFCYPSPAPAKKCLRAKGIISSDEVRLPLVQLDGDESAILKLEALGFSI